MVKTFELGKKVIISKPSKLSYGVFVVILVFCFAIFQDYIYSSIKHTGFYLSESSLYNTLYFFFIPISIYVNRIISHVNPKNNVSRIPINIVLGAVCSIVHICLFTALFVSVSSLVFAPAHRFSSIFNTALSNQFFLLIVWYITFPILYIIFHNPSKPTLVYPDRILLSMGSTKMPISIFSIQLISTDKPYTLVHADGRKILDNRSLKEFESILDPSLFLRIHRSMIINKHCIVKLTSRQNGDYDATCKNGRKIRLSRHYRKNWNILIH